MSNIKKILIVVGTRPNFIKITQFAKVIANYPDLEFKVVHTGQHYDDKMAAVFFRQFNLEPDYYLNIPPSSPNRQIAEIMIGLEKLINETYKPDMILVPGDVNSTLAGALTANKMNIPSAHIESGLRSFDRSMPEEINRIATDDLVDWYFVTEQSGIDHLKNEQKNEEKIFFVGNTMIDTLVAFKDEVQRSDVLEKFNLNKHQYILMTMHRPATVDNKEGLQKLIALLNFLTTDNKVIFPVHPRTMNRLKEFGLDSELRENKNLVLPDPLDYFSFQKLITESKLVITDSGGIQEETTFYQVPCLTLRPNTERPSTIVEGTNELMPFDIDAISEQVYAIEKGTYKKGNIPKFWDGKATERIVEEIREVLSK